MTRRKTPSILRIPRPQGLTLKAQQLSQIPDPNQKQEIKQKLIKYLVNQYVLNDHTICKKYYTYEELSKYLQIDIEETMNLVIKCMKKNTELFDKIDAGISAREHILRAQKKSLEIQALAESQAAILMRSQGNTYKPFVSSEVNKAIGNVISQGKNQADMSFKFLDALIRIMGTKSDGQAMPIFGTQSQEKGTQSLSVSDALILISQHNPRQAWDEELVKALMGPEGTQYPDVRALTQDLRAIGIRHDGTQSLPVEPKALDKDLGNDGPDHKAHHENRRQSDLNILDGAEAYDD